MPPSIHRRSFIKYCGSMAAGTAAANVVAAETKTPSSEAAGPLPKQEANQEDFVFWRFHGTEHLPLGGRITRISEITFRIRLMLYPVGMGDVDDFKWDYGGPPTGREETTTFGSHQFYLTDDPITVRISRPGGILFNAVVEEIRRKEQRSAIRIEAGPQTRFYGLGGQFLGIEHSGREIECHSSDTWGEKVLRQPTWANTYYPIPYLFSTDGYALLFNATVPLKFEFPPRGDSSRRYTVEIASPTVDFYFIDSADPIVAMREYHAVTGEPYVPPKWALEPLVGHASDHAGKCFNKRVLDDYLRHIREDEIPNGIVYDEAWAWTYPEDAEDGTRRLWFHPEKLGDFRIHNFDPEDSGIKALHAEGQKAVFHIQPFVGIRSENVEELMSKGYLVRRASDPALPLVGQYHHYFVDFTNPEAVAWWQDGIRRLLELGVDGFFFDFGESDDQRDALYRTGTGQTVGQAYSLLGRRALFEVLKEVKGGDFYLTSRAGWTGMHQYAGALIGDMAGTFEGMRLALSAMQSFALSGQGVAAHNLGGYAGRQENTVFRRWVQLGVFSPLFAMWNSGGTGEPWSFDEETLADYCSSAKLRMRLLPYLHSCIRQYGETSVPLIRPMALLFPEEAELAARTDQFMCGSEILVCPILNREGTATPYLPPGRWRDFFTGKLLQGGQVLNVQHSFQTLPVFVREGGIVPMEVVPRRVDVEQSPLQIAIHGKAPNQFQLHDDGTACMIRTSVENGTLGVGFQPLLRPEVVWTGRGTPKPEAAVFQDEQGNQKPLAVRWADNAWAVTTPGSGGRLTVLWQAGATGEVLDS